jgi:tetratricopeptide (TPR) repeat protein
MTLGNKQDIAFNLHNLGGLAHEQHRLDEALRLYNESLELSKKLGDQQVIASNLHQLGLIASKQGNQEQAVQLLSEALKIFERLESPYASRTREILKELEGA